MGLRDCKTEMFLMDIRSENRENLAKAMGKYFC